MKITEITIRPATEDLVKGYVDIVFDNCFMIEGIRIIQGPTGLFISFPAKKQRDGTHRDIAFPANAETRMMIQQAILAADSLRFTRQSGHRQTTPGKYSWKTLTQKPRRSSDLRPYRQWLSQRTKLRLPFGAVASSENRWRSEMGDLINRRLRPPVLLTGAIAASHYFLSLFVLVAG